MDTDVPEHAKGLIKEKIIFVRGRCRTGLKDKLQYKKYSFGSITVRKQGQERKRKWREKSLVLR